MEQYVQEHWEFIKTVMFGVTHIICINGPTFKTMQAAYNFTVEREKAIENARYDVARVRKLFSFTTIREESSSRILSREQAHLAELLRGWKE